MQASRVSEKDINLDVSLVLYDLYTATGINALLTRSDDRMLYTENIRGQRKNQDLKNRLAISQNNPDSIFIGIHMNAFPVERYKGLQVYYSRNHPNSVVLADLIQNYARTYIQFSNERNIKGAGSEIFLLHRIKSPAVFIECGFLSNSEEAKLLSDSRYRSKLACMIYCASVSHIIESY